jgi:hypothetical protein
LESQRLKRKGNMPAKLTINEVMDEVLPLLKQKYVVPKFDGSVDAVYTLGKVPRRRRE